MRVAIGLGAFAAFAALGVASIGWQEAGAALAGARRSLAAGPVAAALGLLLADWVLGGLRLHLWVRRFDPTAPYLLSLRTYLVNLFAGAISPLGAASGPAQFTVLVRGGLPPVEATAALLLNYVGILSAMLLVGGLAGAYLSSLTASSGGNPVHQGVLLGAVIMLLMLVPVILSPRSGELLAAAVSSAGGRLGGPIGDLLQRVGAGLARGVTQYRAAAAAASAGWRRSLAGGVLLSSVMLLNKSTIGLLVALGLGFQGDYLEVVARQAVQVLVLYFSPSPGGSGIAEASVPLFMGGLLPEGRSMAFAVVWRTISSYVGVAVGAVASAAVFAPLTFRRRVLP